jgi:CubicO group peptidase (beta-lactamase class C family)
MEAWPRSEWALVDEDHDSIDVMAVREAVARHAGLGTPGVSDMESYLGGILTGQPYQQLLGPLRNGRGPSGVCVHAGRLVAEWGDPAALEMSFSVTKTYLSLLAGVAINAGLIAAVDEPVRRTAPSEAFEGRPHERITWRHLLQQTSGQRLPSVSGGAHWGGGVWASAYDHARVGLLYLRGGRWRDQTVITPQWIEQSWAPCPVKTDYGYLWWRNDEHTVFPDASATGRCARGNGGRQLIWVDPARDLVVVARWTEDMGTLLRDVSEAIRAD